MSTFVLRRCQICSYGLFSSIGGSTHVWMWLPNCCSLETVYSTEIGGEYRIILFLLSFKTSRVISIFLIFSQECWDSCFILAELEHTSSQMGQQVATQSEFLWVFLVLKDNSVLFLQACVQTYAWCWLQQPASQCYCLPGLRFFPWGKSLTWLTVYVYFLLLNPNGSLLQYLVSIPLKMFRLWAFSAMLLQVSSHECTIIPVAHFSVYKLMQILTHCVITGAIGHNYWEILTRENGQHGHVAIPHHWSTCGYPDVLPWLLHHACGQAVTNIDSYPFKANVEWCDVGLIEMYFQSSDT